MRKSAGFDYLYMSYEQRRWFWMCKLERESWNGKLIFNFSDIQNGGD